ncbi:3-oxoacyl-ACP synthase [Pareuzebyella sediminis]|uniref:3-oxoacyl-ACP synthase n=1 Tax=Pareuzebyella sediminis TaxID=2607998 RepID=UPI0011EFAA2D|nr:3-oxoacyl-ACP synthase [Pareuzebyella sediminis]
MKPSSFHIASYCRIIDNNIVKNDEVLFTEKTGDLSSFLKKAYKHMEIRYPKFFKMDTLSKLAFIAAETLLKDSVEKNTALVFSNKSSSLDTDRKHSASITDSVHPYASPAIFVYTLPNICLGEISIRHSLYSENSFFIFDEFNPRLLTDYCDSLLSTGKTEKILCGWVDVDKQEYDAFLYLIARTGVYPYTTDELTRLYRKT